MVGIVGPHTQRGEMTGNTAHIITIINSVKKIPLPEATSDKGKGAVSMIDVPYSIVCTSRE